MLNVVLRKRKSLNDICSKNTHVILLPAIVRRLKKKIKIKLNRRHEVLAKNITFNDVEQPTLSVKRAAAVQIVVPVDNELDDRTPILKNLLFI